MYPNWGSIMAQREHVRDIQREAAMRQLADEALGRTPRDRSFPRPPLAALAYAVLLFLHAIGKIVRV